MSTAPGRGTLMAEYARAIAGRLAAADESLRLAAQATDIDALLIGMAERETVLTATEDLVGELDLAGLAPAEHAAIIRQMVRALELSQVAQAALEAEMFAARRNAARSLDGPLPKSHAGDAPGYVFPLLRRPFRSTG